MSASQAVKLHFCWRETDSHKTREKPYESQIRYHLKLFLFRNSSLCIKYEEIKQAEHQNKVQNQIMPVKPMLMQLRNT